MGEGGGIPPALKMLSNKVRRWIICHFKRGYLQRSVSVRHGDCWQCGKCCELLFRCPALVKKNGTTRCLIYHRGRPMQCRAFPIDLKDLADVKFNCGYFFSSQCPWNS